MHICPCRNLHCNKARKELCLGKRSLRRHASWSLQKDAEAQLAALRQKDEKSKINLEKQEGQIKSLKQENEEHKKQVCGPATSAHCADDLQPFRERLACCCPVLYLYVIV